MEVSSKRVSIALDNKLQKAGEQIWGEKQCGFSRNKSTTDCIFLMRRLTEEVGLTAPEQGGDAQYQLFVDLENASDTCD